MNRKLKTRNQKEAYLFILPIFIFFAIYSVYPLCFNIYYAFTDWSGISQSWNWVGLKNFRELTSDRVLKTIVKNTVVYFFMTIFPQALLGLFLAHIISGMKRGGKLVRALFYFPNIVPLSIICITFLKIFETHGGSLNQLLQMIGMGAYTQQWLAKPSLAFQCLIGINIWVYTGFSMFLYCVSMTNIPSELYEAATIDGAGGFQCFTHITVPLLKNTHMTLILLGMISCIKNFDLPYLVTKGGPAHKTEFFSTYMYYLSFDKFQQGKAAAVVCLMLLASFVLSVLQLKMYGVGLSEKER